MDILAWLIHRADNWVSPIFISVSAKMTDKIGLSRCWQNAIIFLMHLDNWHKKAQQSQSRQLPCTNVSRCIFIPK